MDPIWTKLNLKAPATVLVLQAPDSFAGALASWPDACFTTLEAAPETVALGLAFVTQQQEIDALAPLLAARLPGDSLLWLAYPKGSSKRYRCDFNRDTGWAKLGELGFEPVRQIAIDEDWSALRFRRVAFIKKMTRSFAMTEEGKQKSGK
jgi:hypothetical protein